MLAFSSRCTQPCQGAPADAKALASIVHPATPLLPHTHAETVFRWLVTFPCSDRARTTSWALVEASPMMPGKENGRSKIHPEPPLSLLCLAGCTAETAPVSARFANLTRASLVPHAGPSAGRVGGRRAAVRAQPRPTRRRSAPGLHQAAARREPISAESMGYGAPNRSNAAVPAPTAPILTGLGASSVVL